MDLHTYRRKCLPETVFRIAGQTRLQCPIRDGSDTGLGQRSRGSGLAGRLDDPGPHQIPECFTLHFTCVSVWSLRRAVLVHPAFRTTSVHPRVDTPARRRAFGNTVIGDPDCATLVGVLSSARLELAPLRLPVQRGPRHAMPVPVQQPQQVGDLVQAILGVVQHLPFQQADVESGPAAPGIAHARRRRPPTARARTSHYRARPRTARGLPSRVAR